MDSNVNRMLHFFKTSDTMLRGKFLATILLLVCISGMSESSWSASIVTARENLDILIKTKSCKNCDLAGLNLTRMDLSGADLEGADLSLAKLYLVDLSEANLRNTRLRGAVFGGADLGGADLRGADLRGANLEGAYLKDTKLDGTFVTATPYEDVGVPDLEKEVYIPDPAKPKRNPEKNEIKVAKPRFFSEPPPSPRLKKSNKYPAVEKTTQGRDERAEEKTFLDHLPQPPKQKTVNGPEPVVVFDTKISSKSSAEASEAAPKPSPIMSKVELYPSAEE